MSLATDHIGPQMNSGRDRRLQGGISPSLDIRFNSLQIDQIQRAPIKERHEERQGCMGLALFDLHN
jgi:hypothetical protein